MVPLGARHERKGGSALWRGRTEGGSAERGDDKAAKTKSFGVASQVEGVLNRGSKSPFQPELTATKG